MEWVKTTAKTLPEAIDLALDNLGVDESEAEIVVVEEPRQGLFGRMRGTARVEARVKPKAIRPKTERGRNRKRSEGGRKNDRSRNRSKNRSGDGNDRGGNDRGGNNRGRGNSGGGRNADGGGRGSGRGKGGGRQDADAKTDNGGRQSDGVKAGAAAAAGSAGGGNGSGGQDASGQGNRKKSGGRNSSGRKQKPRSNNNDQDTKPKEESPVEDVAEHLEKFLTGLTEAFGFESGVSVDSSEQDILVGQIEGQHGLLVGPKGRTLDAVQELARISCQRTVPSSVRIKVDVGGYRKQRTEALGAFAAKAAESAVEQGIEVALEPMSPADRKAVHDALSEDDRVETRSVGSEPRRKVLVIPVADHDDEQSEDEFEDEQASVDASNNGVADSEDAGEETVESSEEE